MHPQILISQKFDENMPKWSKKHQKELDAAFADGLLNEGTTLGEAYDLSDTFKTVTKKCFKRYFYKKKREAKEEVEDGVAPAAARMPDSKYAASYDYCTLFNISVL